MSITRLRTVAVLGLAAALLTACGEARPGVAVEVGEETISADDVESIAGDYCTAIEEQLKGSNPAQVIPQRYLAGGVAGTLAIRSVATQLAEEYDVEAGQRYENEVASVRANVSVLPQDVADAVLEIQTAPTYVEAIQEAVGQILLEQEGATASEYSDRVARGKVAFEDWIAEHGVTFDPKLGVALVNGNIEPVDTSVSYPIGEQATAGSAEQPDPGYARSLPDAHRCG